MSSSEIQNELLERRLDAWQAPDAARHYVTGRFRGARESERDGKLLRRLWDDRPTNLRVLDVPCGTGRLWTAFPSAVAQLVAVDRSASMIDQARVVLSASRVHILRADVRELPFPADCFDVVVCCRLLHHFRDPQSLQSVVDELVRVSRGVVLASFFDRCSWHAWRKRVARSMLGRRAGRAARSREELARVFERAGATVDAYAHSARFWSQQAFLRARKGGGG